MTFLRTHQRIVVKEPSAIPKSGDRQVPSGKDRTEALVYLRQKPPHWKDKTRNLINCCRLSVDVICEASGG